MPPYDFGFHPTDLIPGLIFCSEDGVLSVEEKEKLQKVTHDLRGTEDVLCRACGWNKYHELCTSYTPRVRILHTKQNSGLWFLGNDWLLWDRKTSKTTGNDYLVHKFLKEQGSQDIPLVKEMHHFGEAGDTFQFTVMSRAKGEPLCNVWTSLSPEVKKGYAKQVAAALRELRQHTSPIPRRLDGGPLPDAVIGRCGPSQQCKYVGKNKEEWIDGMADELRAGLKGIMKTDDNIAIEARLQELKDNFPESSPYVLTHADLHFANIMVHDGKIEAIIDWETAGYYPCWVERCLSYQRSIEPDDSDEMFDLVWAELDQDMSREQFHQICKPVWAVQKAWNACNTTHTELNDAWFRPAWCECKPLGGIIMRREVDSELKHEIGYKPWAYPGNKKM
ncbi:kinase-like domain-containing protein [Ampelomyces quisqualis]|uniref:Kinase-like domain-containing protein n=1 Tax=Ampelomyces quisqualis TaxID=50730 RepID=A0A6A5QSE1_AMPQU|nr:kinase-like domain-containing protein [Ampelomyces quisqualis]